VGNEQLRARRMVRGWSQEDVVRGLVGLGIETGERQLGVTRSLVSRWERGVTRPRPPYPKLLCLLFEASAEDLGLVSASPAASSWADVAGDTTGVDVERRELLALLYRAAGAAPVWAALPPGLRPSPRQPAPRDCMAARDVEVMGAMEALGAIEALGALGGHPYRRLWAGTPTPALVNPAVAHLNLVSLLLGASRPGAEQARLAALAGEAAEFVGWLAYDMGNLAQGCEHYRSAIVYAEQAAHAHLRAYLIAGMSLWAGLLGDGGSAVRLIEQARSLVPSHGLPTAEAWLAAREAVAYARIGETSTAMHAVGRFEAAASRARPGEEPWPWAFPFDDARVAMYRGTVATILKLPKLALPALQQGIDWLAPTPDRGAKRSAEAGDKLRALVLCDLAESYVCVDEIEESCRLLAEAFAIGLRMGCDRVLRRVGDIRTQMAPRKDLSAVRELEQGMMDSVLDIPGTPAPDALCHGPVA
jgi:transcriptional regulator with XRE-family HTH domain